VSAPRSIYRLSIETHAKLSEILKILVGQVVSIVLRADGGDEAFELGALRRQNLEPILVALDDVAKRPEDVIEAERMDRAYVEICVVARLYIKSQTGLDFLNGGVRVRDARDSPWSVADFINNTRKLGDDDTRLAAAGTCCQNQVVTTPHRVSLFVG